MSFREHFRAYWLTTIFGTILFTAGTLVLYWNEGQAVRKAQSLNEALVNVVSVRAEEPIDINNEGRLVHLVGDIIASEPLTEPDYGIQVLAVKLKRRVQMFQWIEEEMYEMCWLEFKIILCISFLPSTLSGNINLEKALQLYK